jgi:putative flippase GtrA
MRDVVKQVAGAGLAGLLGTAIDVAVLAALVERGAAGVASSTFAGAIAGAGVSYVTSKYVAFRDRSSVRLGQVARFGAVALATAVIMALAMELVAVVMGVPYLLAKGICAAVVFAIWSYPAQRLFVFRPPTRSASASLA